MFPWRKQMAGLTGKEVEVNSVDRVCGVLVGLAAGDFHGGPIRMAVRIAESLAAHNGFQRDDVMDRYMTWYREGAFDTGPVADRVFARVLKGESVEEAVKAVHISRDNMTAGCNPAHRAVPLAMCRGIDLFSLSQAAVAEASLTHFDSIAGEVSAAVVILCRRLIEGAVWTDALLATSEGRDSATKHALSVVSEQELDRGGYAPSVLAAAIYYLDRHRSLQEALTASFEFAGRWNFCPVLVGAIGGARWGASAVPVERIRHTELMPRVTVVAQKLSALWASSSGSG